ncbi:hypothetical protein [Nitratireductor pacificus]|uniref:hypothetical protein n=1 Tax=Nitratireductor pacificus TaxID=1231180 RepID=UPI0002D64386|nr:hypothetical protein [Nitratireductor pacificus]
MKKQRRSMPPSFQDFWTAPLDTGGRGNPNFAASRAGPLLLGSVPPAPAPL